MRATKALCLAVLLCCGKALASDVLVGTIVSAGTSVNNLTTASPFQVPQGPILLQCSAEVYVYSNKDATTAVATSAVGIKIAEDAIYPTSTTPSRSVVAILPVSGSGSCKVFAVYGDTASRRYIPSGTAAALPDNVLTADMGSLVRSNEFSYMRGVSLQGQAGDVVIDMPYKSILSFGPFPSMRCVSGGDSYYGASDRFIHCGIFEFQQVNVRQLSGYHDEPIDLTGSVKWYSITLATCNASLEKDTRALFGTGGASSGTPTRLCFCQSDGAGAYAWRNIITGNIGDSTTCPA